MSSSSHAPVDLLVLVHSHPRETKDRHAARDTWAHPELTSSLRVKVVFVLQWSEVARKNRAELQWEENLTGDLVLVTGSDVTGLGWAGSHCPHTGPVLLLASTDYCVDLVGLKRAVDAGMMSRKGFSCIEDGEGGCFDETVLLINR